MAVYQHRRSSRTRYLLVFLVLASITLITLDSRSSGRGFLGAIRSDARAVLAPIQSAAHSALQPVGNFFTGALDYGKLRAENQRLRNEVISMQQRGVKAAYDQQQARQVLANEHLGFVGKIPSVAVRVISRGSSNFETAVTINRGTRSGIAQGQPVVEAGGLVGDVSQAGPNTATVVLLTDPAFVVGVRVGKDNIGAAEGFGRARDLRVSVVSTNLPPPRVKPGQELFTSGLNMEKFPPGIPVGKVVKVTKSPGSTEPQITLAPLVNLNQLNYLRVLLWSPQ